MNEYMINQEEKVLNKAQILENEGWSEYLKKERHLN